MLESQGILDALPFYVMLVDSKHKILMANKGVKQALGVAPEAIIGGYCPKLIHGLDEPFPGCPVEEAVRERQAVEKEFFEPSFRRWMKSKAYPVNYPAEKGELVFLHLIQDITQEKETQIQLQHSSDIQSVLAAILRLSLEDISLDEVLNHTLNLIIAIPWLASEKRGAIFLADNNTNTLVMKAQNGLSAPLLESCKRLPFGKCLCGRAAQNQEIQYAGEIDNRHEIRCEGISPHSHYCVPFVSSGKTLGVINLYLKEGHSRSQVEESFLAAIGNTLVGVFLSKNTDEALKESLSSLQKAFLGSVQALSSVSEKRDPYTAGHQARVTHLACAIAKEMKLDEEQVTSIRIAGILHDIGKIAVPSDILSRPGRLSEAEFAILRTHPQVGCDILKTIEFPWPVAEVVLQHHERLNGSGYPQGLTGGQICIEAKILAVADTVEAMSSHRPYRPALGTDIALEEITSKKEIFYDAAVVDACVRLFREKNFEFEQTLPRQDGDNLMPNVTLI